MGTRVGTQLREQHRTDERDLELLQQLVQARKKLTDQIARRIIGQVDAPDEPPVARPRSRDPRPLSAICPWSTPGEPFRMKDAREARAPNANKGFKHL